MRILPGEKNPFMFIGVFLVSFATLMLEIGITRIFSVLFEYHYSFLAVSLSILGLGAGGIFYHIKRKQQKYRLMALRSAGQGFGIAVLTMIAVIVFIPSLNVLYLTALFALIPFFFAGIFLSASFERLAEFSGRLYAVDLSGAALGSVAVVFALKLGAIAVALIAGFLASCASIAVWNNREKRKIPKRDIVQYALPVVMVLVLFLNIFLAFPGPVPFAQSAQKEMLSLMNNPLYEAQRVETSWSHFGRTDLVRSTQDESEMVFFIDGTAGASMLKFNGDFGNIENKAVLDLKRTYSGYFPMALLSPQEKRSALIIGPGGGRDILAAKLAGVASIAAVEINPDFVKLGRKYADYNGGLFNKKDDIKVVVDEGRSFLKRSDEKYDIIFLSIPVTKTSRSPEGYALSENFLFTVESIDDYLEHLNDNGRIIVVAHNDLEIFKLMILALEVFKRKGLTPEEALNHVYTTGPHMLQVFVLKKSPITPEEADFIHGKAMYERHYQTETTFIPHISQHPHRIPMGEAIFLKSPMLNDIFLGLQEGRYDPASLIQGANVDLRPNSDNRPFFYKMQRGLPEEIWTLLILSAGLTALVLSIRPRQRGPKERILFRRDVLFRYLFFSLGVGFMLIEIPLIQKFSLFLGQPVYSLSVLLFSLLGGAGIGSYMSEKIKRGNLLSKLLVGCLGISILTILFLGFGSDLIARFLGETIIVRMIVSGGMILPLGLFLGVPFPVGIRLMHALQRSSQVPRMWGINGFSTVFGSVMAVFLALTSGFHVSLMIGAFIYFFIVLIFLSQKSLFVDLKTIQKAYPALFVKKVASSPLR